VTPMHVQLSHVVSGGAWGIFDPGFVTRQQSCASLAIS
jgi:hypothetical protein